MTDPLSISVVINTDSRAGSLADTLLSLRLLDYPRFEVCVVHGPTPDGTKELLTQWQDQIKVAACPVRDLSISRNIGVALAAGEIVAFIDDDAIPEPEWLRDIAAAYDAPDIGGAGGFVHDYTGVGFQCRFVTLDRLGVASERARATPELNFPLSADIPHLLGTNCSFRREALVSVGGFDEQIGRYLDESDVCCRLVDGGWRLAQVAGAYVHHRLLPDDLRTEQRAIRSWHPLIKNKLYVPFVNGRQHVTAERIVADARRFVQSHADDTAWAIEKGFLPRSSKRRFLYEAARAWRDGLAQGLAGQRRFIEAKTLERDAQPFLAFATTSPAGGRRTFCLLSQDYPPARPGGIARYTQQLAASMAKRGHRVHVLTRGSARDSVAFEDGIWVHRIVPRDVARPDGLGVPPHIWAYAATMLREIERIAERRPIDAVYAPLWDCEGLAVLIDGRFPLVTALQTPLSTYLDSNPELKSDTRFMSDFGAPMLALEKRLLAESPAINAVSAAIVGDIERSYGLALAPSRRGLVPLGLADWSQLPGAAPATLPEGALRILFVGRLEKRKGIDVLLEAARTLLARHQQVYLDIVGSEVEHGYRAAFERDASPAAVRAHVRFHGEVAEDALRGFYRACDIFVAPSRYESFGLVLIEAMMFAKPVIACRIGGMPEIVLHDKTGLLAEPGDRQSLHDCMERLIEDDAMRRRLGATGRRRYEEHFTDERMTDALLEWLATVPRTSRHADPPSPKREGAARRDLTPPSGIVRRVSAAVSVARVALVSSVIARHDAISTAVRHTVRALAQPQFELAVLTARNDFAEIPAQIVSGLGALLLHPAFRAADLVIYHFGIHHPLIDALIAAEGRARQIVAFHNITPAALVGPQQRPVIEASFHQLFNLRCADRIWCPSGVNAKLLEAHGFDARKIDVIPLAVDRPAHGRLAKKTARDVELLFVGRIVPAKGVSDLIEAVDVARRQGETRLRLSIVGNLAFSDPAYVGTIKREIAVRRLSCVRFLGTVDDGALEELYRATHILVFPSFHEGFGVPVIEALRAGCIPVGYAAHNLPFVAAGLGRMVPTGDREQLAAALIDVIAGLALTRDRPDASLLRLDGGTMSREAFDQAARAHVAQFAGEQIADEIRRSVREVLDGRADARGMAGGARTPP